VSTGQGNRVNVLTIVTMIFLPNSFLTGCFGMNVTRLDNQLNSFWSWAPAAQALPIQLVVVSVVLLSSSGYTVPRLLHRSKHGTARG
jgi:Mg2+ and Co2+ transporter CorA